MAPPVAADRAQPLASAGARDRIRGARELLVQPAGLAGLAMLEQQIGARFLGAARPFAGRKALLELEESLHAVALAPQLDQPRAEPEERAVGEREVGVL